MTTQVVKFQGWDASTTAALRSFGSQISTAIQATGLTKLSNTGQIDWTSATAAATLGYEMYRFNDPLQSSAPVFIRFQWAMNTSTWPYISTVTVGRAVDSSTNFLGRSASMSYCGGVATTNKQANYVTWRFCYNPAMGYFGMSSWDYPIPTTTGIATRGHYTISRPCDDTGTPTTSGLWCQAFGGLSTTTGSQLALSYENNTLTSYVNGAVAGINTASNLASGLTVPFFHQTAAFPTVRQIPQVLYYARDDLPRGVPVTMNVFGTNHTYMTLGIMGSGASGTAHTSGAYAMLWE